MEEVLAEALGCLRKETGVDLEGYRRSTLERRLRVRMARLRILDPQTYLRRLRDDPEEIRGLLDTITVNVSGFFRDPPVFEQLFQRVLPELVERKQRNGRREIRAWSAGCASGEEPYSLAILLHQLLREELPLWELHLFATDMGAQVLESARRGNYEDSRVENVRLGDLARYFEPVHGRKQVKAFIRRMVHFSQDDLCSEQRVAPSESVFGTFDLVLCRNVLIYFNRQLQQRVFARLLKSLAPGGYLVLGTSEALPPGMKEQLDVTDGRCRIYRKPL